MCLVFLLCDRHCAQCNHIYFLNRPWQQSCEMGVLRPRKGGVLKVIKPHIHYFDFNETCMWGQQEAFLCYFLLKYHTPPKSPSYSQSLTFSWKVGILPPQGRASLILTTEGGLGHTRMVLPAASRRSPTSWALASATDEDVWPLSPFWRQGLCTVLKTVATTFCLT